jgi:hypothetical protein
MEELEDFIEDEYEYHITSSSTSSPIIAEANEEDLLADFISYIYEMSKKGSSEDNLK